MKINKVITEGKIMKTEFFERSKGTIAYDDSKGDGELVLMLGL